MTTEATERLQGLVQAGLVPPRDHDSEEFWGALRAHRVLVQRCTACGTYRWPPRCVCGRCQSWDTEWVDAHGTGRIVTWTVTHHAPPPGFVAPYNVALVELDEQDDLLLPGTVVGCANHDIYAGMAVTAEFDDLGPDLTLLHWRRAASNRLDAVTSHQASIP